MSVYSGFATRQLEQQYNKQVVNLIKVLQRRVMKFYLGEQADEEAFKQVFQQIFGKLSTLEDSKYNEPYYSSYLQEICGYLSIDYQSFQLVRQNQSITSQVNHPAKCHCKCHQQNSQERVPLTTPQNSAFLTHIDISQQKILLQPINVSQERIISKNSFDLLSRSGRQYFSVSRGSSKRQKPVRDYIQFATNKHNDRVQSGKYQQQHGGNMSLELTQYGSTQDQFRTQRSPRPMLTTADPKGTKPQSQRQNNRSPYYSTVYSLNGKTYTKVSYQKTYHPHKTSNPTPRNISVSPQTKNLKNIHKLSINVPRQIQTVAPKAPIPRNQEQAINEVNSVQENDSRKQSKSVLLQEQKQISVRQSLTATDKYQVLPIEHEICATLETHPKEIPNPNESLNNSLDHKEHDSS